MTMHPLSSSRLAWTHLTVATAGFPAANSNKLQSTNAFQTSACIIFTSIQQAKATPTAKFSFEGWRNGLHFLIERTTMPPWAYRDGRDFGLAAVPHASDLEGSSISHGADTWCALSKHLWNKWVNSLSPYSPWPQILTGGLSSYPESTADQPGREGLQGWPGIWFPILPHRWHLF